MENGKRTKMGTRRRAVARIRGRQRAEAAAIMGAPGCDDAPSAEITCGTRAKPFTLIMPYYENPAFFRQQLEHWLTFPIDIAANMRVIIVDDGSPTHPAADVIRAASWPGWLPCPIRVFRISLDVRWNWLAARNIGAHHAPPGWLMITDMDHVLPPGTARALVYGDHDPNVIYRFQRREHTGHGIHPHPNSWFYTRDMYWKVGGHDETFSGYYGTDGEYRRRCAATAPIRIMDCALERHEKLGDSSTTHYKRKQPEDARVKRLIQARKKDWRPKVLSFPYEEVCI